MKKHFLHLVVGCALVFACAAVCPAQQEGNSVQRIVAGMRADLDSMMDRIRNLQAENEDLRSQLQVAKQRAQAAEEALAGLNNRMAALEKNTSQKLSQMQSAMATDQAQRQKDFKSLSDDMAKILRQSSGGSTAVRSSGGKRSLPQTPAAMPSTDKYYEIEVMAGDTLSSIATAAGVSTRELMQFNQLKSANHIRVGQKLKIPSRDEKK